MGRFYHGMIVEVWVDDGNGRTKERPAVIIERDESCDRGGPFLAVAITKSFDLPLPYYHIKVHDSNNRHPVTGLRFPCVAKCNWPRYLEERRIIRKLGDMPAAILFAICEAFDRIQDDPSFDDWQ